MQKPAKELLRQSKQSNMNTRIVAHQQIWSVALIKPHGIVLAVLFLLTRERGAKHRKEMTQKRAEKKVCVAQRVDRS